jgi:hypothetical protein
MRSSVLFVMASMAKQQVGQPTNSATGGGDLFRTREPHEVVLLRR